MRTQGDWIKEYEEHKAFWLHDGKKERPHALLTGGNHSNGFFFSKPVVSDEGLLREISYSLVGLWVSSGGPIARVDKVVGPQTGATKLAESIAYEITILRGRRCFWASPRKEGDGADKKMVFESCAISAGETILLCEDVLTTGSSVELTSAAVMALGGGVMPYVLAIVNRSGIQKVGIKSILTLVDTYMLVWSPDECPLCQNGSEAIRPKEGDNWDRLNADY